MKRTLSILIAVLMVVSCGKKKSPVPEPAKAVLVFPAQNTVCLTGTVISDTQSSVTLTWNSAANTTSYDVILKNLVTNSSSTLTTSNTQLTIPLQRATPYSWQVITRSADTDKSGQSDVWKFYNAGLGAVTYAPFPAEIVAPAYGQGVPGTSLKVNLVWKGSAVDNNITGYDVYFGETANPGLLKANIKDMFLNDVAVKANTNYFWRVVTSDANGNYSDSGTYQFKVN